MKAEMHENMKLLFPNGVPLDKVEVVAKILRTESSDPQAKEKQSRRVSLKGARTKKAKNEFLQALREMGLANCREVAKHMNLASRMGISEAVATTYASTCLSELFLLDRKVDRTRVDNLYVYAVKKKRPALVAY